MNKTVLNSSDHRHWKSDRSPCL